MGETSPLHVLHVLNKMDRGGAESVVMNWFRHQDPKDVVFDFLVHTEDPGDYDEEIRSLGGSLQTVHPFNGINGAAYRREIAALLADHPEWEVVHGHMGSAASRYLKEAVNAGRVAIAHSHGINGTLSLHELAYRAISFPVRAVAQDFLGCSGQAGLDRFGRAIVHSDRYHTIPNGIDVEEYRVDAVRHLDAKRRFGWDGRTVVGHVGRFTILKNHFLLLEAFAAFRSTCPEALLVLVGRGELESDVRRRAAELGIGSDTVFFGVTDDVASVLAAFDIFIFPSHSEGLGIACVEAQAAGLPVLVSDHVPSEAILTPSVKVVPLAAGPEGWAMAMGEALAAGPNWQNGPDQVRKGGFDAAMSAEWLANHYHELVKKNRDQAL